MTSNHQSWEDPLPPRFRRDLSLPFGVSDLASGMYTPSYGSGFIGFRIWSLECLHSIGFRVFDSEFGMYTQGLRLRLEGLGFRV